MFRRTKLSSPSQISSFCPMRYPPEDNIEPLKTDVKSLQRKYNLLKAEWRKISDKAKIGSGLGADKEHV